MTEHRENIEKLCLPQETTLRETLRFIDANSRQMALVIDEERRLLGVVTDGDVRRALLRGEGHDVLVKDIMNKTPKVARNGEETAAAADSMSQSARELKAEADLLDKTIARFRV